jgi:hypothetical protein
MKLFWMSVAKLAQEKAGLYDGDSYKGSMDLMDAIDWINAEGIDGANYRIVLGKDEAIPYASLDCEGKQVSVSLKGAGQKEHTVRWEGSSDRPLFWVHTGVTFTLEDGVALVGMSESKSPVVVIEEGGTFNMSGGSISGNSAEMGGGVGVGRGIFTMSGGSISGNSAEVGGGVFVDSGTFTMSGGTISGNSASIDNGGGVYVQDGTFIKSKGSIIYGSNAPAEQANTASEGAAVYCNNGSKRRDTTARINTVMDSTKDGTAGGWE